MNDVIKTIGDGTYDLALYHDTMEAIAALEIVLDRIKGEKVGGTLALLTSAQLEEIKEKTGHDEIEQLCENLINTIYNNGK